MLVSAPTLRYSLSRMYIEHNIRSVQSPQVIEHHKLCDSVPTADREKVIKSAPRYSYKRSERLQELLILVHAAFESRLLFFFSFFRSSFSSPDSSRLRFRPDPSAVSMFPS